MLEQTFTPTLCSTGPFVHQNIRNKRTVRENKKPRYPSTVAEIKEFSDASGAGSSEIMHPVKKVCTLLYNRDVSPQSDFRLFAKEGILVRKDIQTFKYYI